MPTYILDTNILTDLESPGTPAYKKIIERMAALPEESEVCFSILSAYEYQHGIANASKELAIKLEKSWLTFLDLFEVLPLSLEGAKWYGKIKK